MRKNFNFTDILEELGVKRPSYQSLVTNILLFIIVIVLGMIWQSQKAYEKEVAYYRGEFSRLEQSYQELIALEKVRDTDQFSRPSSENQESVTASSKKTSSSSSSNIPKTWSPTANREVNSYLNQPGGAVKLRGIIISQFDSDVNQRENWVEIQSSFIGIDLEGVYQEYAIVNDRLYVRMKGHTSVKLGTEVSIDARVIEKVHNERLGILALEAKEFRILPSQESQPQQSSAETLPSSTTRQVPPSTTPSSSSNIPQSTPPSAIPENDSPQVPPVYYENCSAAKRAGVSNIRVGQPGYAPHLDRDKDGIACED